MGVKPSLILLGVWGEFEDHWSLVQVPLKGITHAIPASQITKVDIYTLLSAPSPDQIHAVRDPTMTHTFFSKCKHGGHYG